MPILSLLRNICVKIGSGSVKINIPLAQEKRNTEVISHSYQLG